MENEKKGVTFSHLQLWTALGGLAVSLGSILISLYLSVQSHNIEINELKEQQKIERIKYEEFKKEFNDYEKKQLELTNDIKILILEQRNK